MTTTRRGFAQTAVAGLGLALLSSTSVVLTGCSTSIISAISAYVGVGLQAFQAVISLLSAAGVIPPGTGTLLAVAIAAVKAGFADVLAAIADYNAAPAADKASLLGKISSALSAVSMELQKFWSDLNIPDSSLASLVEGLLGIILSTLAGFVTQLPAPTTPPPAASMAKQIPVTPQRRSMAQFRKEFNAKLAAGGHPEQHI